MFILHLLIQIVIFELRHWFPLIPVWHESFIRLSKMHTGLPHNKPKDAWNGRQKYYRFLNLMNMICRILIRMGICVKSAKTYKATVMVLHSKTQYTVSLILLLLIILILIIVLIIIIIVINNNGQFLVYLLFMIYANKQKYIQVIMYCMSLTDSDIVRIKPFLYLLCCRWIATPLAISAGIRQRVHLKAEDNPILELYYTTQCRNPAQVNSQHFVTNVMV